MPTLAVPSSIMRVRSRVLRAQWRTSKYWLFSSASRSVRASTLPDCSKTAVGTCLTSVLIAQPKMNSIATGTKSMSVSARRSRPSWRNSLAMIPWSRLPTASALRGAERPELLAHPRLPLAVHERDEHVLGGQLDHRPGEGFRLDPRRRAVGDQLPLVDEAERVAQLGLVHVVGRHHDRRALVGEVPDDRAQRAAPN